MSTFETSSSEGAKINSENFEAKVSKFQDFNLSDLKW